MYNYIFNRTFLRFNVSKRITYVFYCLFIYYEIVSSVLKYLYINLNVLNYYI